MPDLTTGLRPVVRRVSSSGVHKDILNKFEKSSTPTSSYSASSSRRSSTSSTTSLITGSTTKLSRSRPGSIKTTKSTVSWSLVESCFCSVSAFVGSWKCCSWHWHLGIILHAVKKKKDEDWKARSSLVWFCFSVICDRITIFRSWSNAGPGQRRKFNEEIVGRCIYRQV